MASTIVEAPKVDIHALDYTVDISAFDPKRFLIRNSPVLSVSPSVATVGKTIQQTIVVKNLTDNVSEFKFEVQDNHDETSGFAVSGLTKTTFQINPKGTHSIELTLFPLTPGRVAFPRVGIKPQLLPQQSVRPDLTPYWSSKWIFVEPSQSPLLL